MSFFELKFQPGVRRGSTLMPSAGWLYDCNLVRQPDDWLQPVGGWRLRDNNADAFTGVARSLLCWRANSGDRWTGVGTSSHLYVMSKAGIVTDITPTGFTAGNDNAQIYTGYGGGSYGAGPYGTPRPDTGNAIPATMWTLDTWGERLVACSNSDGKIYEWDLNVANDAAVLSNAPTDCQGIVVTDERILMALGAGGNARKVQWCDQEDNNDWTPSSTNQAGDYEFKTAGQQIAGKTIKGGTLIFTTVDAWLATYVGYPLVYGFERVAEGCGVVSSGAIAQIDDVQVAWMTKDSFWLFNGYAQPIECDVRDYVFSNINKAQISKVVAVRRAAFGEITWFYPSSSSVENDSYVTWCYRRGKWFIGRLARTCGVDAGVFTWPQMIDPDGLLYQHEVGFDYGGATPYAVSGPMEMSKGDYMMEVQRYVPDEKTLGDATLTLYGRNWPDDADVTYGPIAAAARTDLLFQARIIRVRYDFAALTDSRIGIPKLEIIRGDPI